MSVLARKLRWRVLRGSHWFDLVEENRSGEPTVYIGLIDGQEAMRLPDRRGAEVELIKLSLGRGSC